MNLVKAKTLFASASNLFSALVLTCRFAQNSIHLAHIQEPCTIQEVIKRLREINVVYNRPG